MISKGLSIFLSQFPINYFPHLLPFKVKLLEKDIYIYYLPFLVSIHFLIYSFTITSLKLLSSGLLITSLFKNPMDRILFQASSSSISQQHPTQLFFEASLSLVFCALLSPGLSLNLSGCYFSVSNVSFPSSTRTLQVTRSLLFSIPGVGKLLSTS